MYATYIINVAGLMPVVEFCKVEVRPKNSKSAESKKVSYRNSQTRVQEEEYEYTDTPLLFLHSNI